MEKNKLNKVADAVSSALNYLYQDCDAVCDDSYYDEIQGIIEELENADNILKEELNRLP